MTPEEWADEILKRTVDTKKSLREIYADIIAEAVAEAQRERLPWKRAAKKYRQHKYKWMAVFDDTMDSLFELKEAQRWIPVSERMPEPGQRVRVGYWWRVNNQAVRPIWTEQVEEWDRGLVEIFTHWTPYFEPPREDQP